MCGISRQKPTSISCFDRPKSPKIRHHIPKNRPMTPWCEFKHLRQQSHILLPPSSILIFDIFLVPRLSRSQEEPGKAYPEALPRLFRLNSQPISQCKMFPKPLNFPSEKQHNLSLLELKQEFSLA